VEELKLGAKGLMQNLTVFLGWLFWMQLVYNNIQLAHAKLQIFLHSPGYFGNVSN
jgi:hypothetical protein